MEKIEVVLEDVGKRLDIFVNEKHSNLSRSFIKNAIDRGEILLNEKIVKAGEKIRLFDVVTIEKVSLQEISVEKQKIGFEIVFQDEDLIVVNKPQGLVVHPCTSTKSGTLVNGLLERIGDLSGINGVLRPGIVHRLDKETSGLMVVAKNDFSHNHLAKQIKEKTCKRKYLALLHGHLPNVEGEIQTKISRHKKDRKKMAVADEGKEAITKYKVVKYFENHTLAEFSLMTGRTHQIRVHSAYLYHPIVGDKVYGKEEKGLQGQLLHSYKLQFVHPKNEKVMSFEIPLPKHFQTFLAKLKEFEY